MRARIHEMDAMRSVLMLLGVVLHSALPYASGHHWLVSDSAQSPVMTAIVAVIHEFRMPGFFVVAGYFAMMVLRSRSTRLFLADRLRRMLVPFCVVFLSFNMLQMWILTEPSPTGLVDFLQRGFLPKLWDSHAVGHLWFLLYLALYVLVVAAASGPLRRFADRGWADKLREPWMIRGLLLFASLAPLALVAANHVVDGAIGGMFGGIIDGFDLLYYAPFFALGMVFESSDQLLANFARPRWPDYVIGLLAASLLTAGIVLGIHEGLANALLLVVTAATSWFTTRILFQLFRRYASKPSATWRYLSDASYSVYLFHHIAVIVMALLLLPYHWPAGVKYLVVMLVASVWALGIHHFVVRRFALAGYLFNGRKARHSTAVQMASGSAA